MKKCWQLSTSKIMVVTSVMLALCMGILARGSIIGFYFVCDSLKIGHKTSK